LLTWKTAKLASLKVFFQLLTAFVYSSDETQKQSSLLYIAIFT